MRALEYIRVSTREQDENIQRKAIQEFAEARGIEILEWYVDAGQSGAKPFKDRPAASKLLQDLDKYNPDIIISWSLDRLGRTMQDTLNTIIDLEKRGYKVVTVKEEWLQTLDSNIRKLILGILAWFAEYERKRIRERQEEAWKQGKQKGRPPKVPDKIMLKYIRRYGQRFLKEAWRHLVTDGYEISYWQFLRRAKRLLSSRVQ